MRMGLLLGCVRWLRWVGAIERVGPRENLAEVIAGDGSLVVRRHRRLGLPVRAKHLSNRGSGFSRVVSAERVAVHGDVVQRLALGLLAGCRVAAEAMPLERRLRVRERSLFFRSRPHGLPRIVCTVAVGRRDNDAGSCQYDKAEGGLFGYTRVTGHDSSLGDASPSVTFVSRRETVATAQIRNERLRRSSGGPIGGGATGRM